MSKPNIQCFYVNQDADSFAKEYGISIKDYKCPECNNVFKTDIPFLMKGYAGLVTKEHECGPKYIEIVLAPNTEQEKEKWEEILNC